MFSHMIIASRKTCERRAQYPSVLLNKFHDGDFSFEAPPLPTRDGSHEGYYDMLHCTVLRSVHYSIFRYGPYLFSIKI